MESPTRIFVKPSSWTMVSSSNKDNTSVQIFGTTSKGQTIYIRIPYKPTYILKFSEDINDDIIENIKETLNPSSYHISDCNSTILILKDPEMAPNILLADPDLQKLATWIEAEKDPYGELQSFWEYKQIGPYEWLTINKYTPIPDNYTTCDINIKVSEEDISKSSEVLDFKDFKKVMFWDIEVFSSKRDEFPDANKIDDYVALISIINSYGDNREFQQSYVIIKGNVDAETLNKRPDGPIIIVAKDEKDLLNKFFAIYTSFQPDRQVYHNGDMFDMPYILDRLSINNMKIPHISKIISLSPWVTRHSYQTSFGREFAKTIVAPGVETIDLVHYYRRFYPFLRNHKLDTIGKIFLGEGKTGLTIEEMMNAIRTDDPVKLVDVIDYSYIDSLRMSELWEVGNIGKHIEIVCNNLAISSDVLLRESFDNIIDRVTYNINPGCSINKGKKDFPTSLKEASKGIYRDVYIYDYSELYRRIMLQSEDDFTAELGDRLRLSPPGLIVTAFYSSHVNRTKLLPLLENSLKNILSTNVVIALEPFIIRSIGPLNNNLLRLAAKLPCYVSVSKASYITFDNNGELETSGIAKLCRPKFRLALNVIKNYITLVYTNNLKNFALPDFSQVPFEDFVITETLRNTRDLKPDTIKFKLLSQYGSVVDTFVPVKYVVIKRGTEKALPILINKLQQGDELDTIYYTKELSKYVKDLKSLQIYGI